ncbi:MAG: pectate lyase [Myxococcales bacterium]
MAHLHHPSAILLTGFLCQFGFGCSGDTGSSGEDNSVGGSLVTGSSVAQQGGSAPATSKTGASSAFGGSLASGTIANTTVVSNSFGGAQTSGGDSPGVGGNSARSSAQSLGGGGANTDATNVGGTIASGGSKSNSKAAGGTTNSGKASAGGTSARNSTSTKATGGSTNGGKATGGSATGGKTTEVGGGVGTGGKATGGSATGGKAAGGNATGGASTTVASNVIGPTVTCGCTTSAGEYEGNDIASTIVVEPGQVFDGKCKTFRASKTALGPGDQSEDQKPVFRVNGGTLQNVILGASAADGIHIYGDATLKNVHWLDIGEDALTVKAASNLTIDCGSSNLGEDKTFQVNAASTIVIRNFTAKNAGKFMRQNGDTTFKMSVTIDHCDISNMDECIYRTDSSTSTVTLTNTRYSKIGDGLFVFGSKVVNGASNQSTVSNNQSY